MSEQYRAHVYMKACTRTLKSVNRRPLAINGHPVFNKLYSMAGGEPRDNACGSKCGVLGSTPRVII